MIMTNRFQTAASALRFIFFGQLLSILSALHPLFGFAGSLFVLYGIFKARTANKFFDKAFMMMMTNILISLALPLLQLIPGLVDMTTVFSVIILIVSAASSVIAFFQNFYIIKGTMELLEELREEEIIRKGELVWKLLIVLMVINLVLPLILFISIPENALNMIAAAISVFNIFAVVMFLIFIYKSFNVFIHADDNVINV